MVSFTFASGRPCAAQSPLASIDSFSSQQQTATQRSSRIPIASRPLVAPTHTSASAREGTTAWAHHWRASTARLQSPCCASASPACVLTAAPNDAAASRYVSSSAYRLHGTNATRKIVVHEAWRHEKAVVPQAADSRSSLGSTASSSVAATPHRHPGRTGPSDVSVVQCPVREADRMRRL
jgi:hypothetical protein